MNYEVVVTCAVTGAGDTTGKHPGVPVTPKQVADAAIEDAISGGNTEEGVTLADAAVEAADVAVEAADAAVEAADAAIEAADKDIEKAHKLIEAASH